MAMKEFADKYRTEASTNSLGFNPDLALLPYALQGYGIGVMLESSSSNPSEEVDHHLNIGCGVCQDSSCAMSREELMGTHKLPTKDSFFAFTFGVFDGSGDIIKSSQGVES
jgi:hypothetical protein